MLVNGVFTVYLNLAFKTMDKISELVAQLDDTTSPIIRNAMSIIYDIYLHDYKTKNDLTAIGEKLLNYYAPFLYSNLRAEFFQ